MERKKINILKIGGAGLQDAEHIKMFANYLKHLIVGANIIVVCSAMKDVTRLLVSIFESMKDSNEELMRNKLNDFFLKHSEVIEGLAPGNKRMMRAFKKLFGQLKTLIESPEKYSKDEMYASILQHGELASSMILSMYLRTIGVRNYCFDAREYIKTTGSNALSSIDSKSEELIGSGIPKLFKKSSFLVTQGFIGRDITSGENTILPFDGSDTSAAFFAHSVLADKMTFLKDVCGVCAHDCVIPYDTTNFFHQMTYDEYLKMFKKRTKYPVHPDAIKILKQRKIPIRVCSYSYPYLYGTEIKR